MKVLKTIGIILLALIGLFLLLGLIAPKEVSTVRSATVNAPPAAVYATVNELTTWEKWSPWVARDATTKVSYSEQTSGEGAYYSWTSENSGEGTMTIDGAWPNDSLKTVVDFDGQGHADATWTFAPQDNGTLVSWSFQSRFPYPFNTMLLFSDFKGMIETDYDQGLELLKQYVETHARNSTATTYDIQSVDMPARHFVTHRAVVAMNDMSQHFQNEMSKLGQAVQDKKLTMTGAPAGLYYLWDEENGKTDLAMAVPVAAGEKLDGYTVVDLPAAKALVIDYYGSYEGSAAAHYAMDEYIKANNLEWVPPVMEEYVTDPTTEPDTSKWLTRIVYYVKQ